MKLKFSTRCIEIEKQYIFINDEEARMGKQQQKQQQHSDLCVVTKQQKQNLSKSAV